MQSGVFVRDLFVQVSPLSAPSSRITVSGVPPFIPNELLENELRKYRKFASGFKTVSLGCKDPKRKHVQSLRQQVLHAGSGQMKCFECGDVGHKCYVCLHKQQVAAHGSDAVGGTDQAATFNANFDS